MKNTYLKTYTPSPKEGDTETGVRNIRVEVYYDLGGMGSFGGGRYSRGIYLSVRESYLEERGAFTSEKFLLLGTGNDGRMLLKPLSRASAKAGMAEAERVKPLISEMVKAYNTLTRGQFYEYLQSVLKMNEPGGRAPQNVVN